MNPDDDTQEPKNADTKGAAEEEASYTSISFWQMLGIPLPDSASIEELLHKLIELGAKPWHPKPKEESDNRQENEPSQDDSET